MSVDGEAGDFRVVLQRRPRYIIEDKCTGCTTCVEYCPVEYPDRFNQDISDNKAVHIYFSQAIPLVAYIDQSCLYLKEKKCRICENVCQNNAIDFNQTAKNLSVNVGAIILAPGFESFDPSVKKEYHYGDFINVVTSMDYERLLCTTGPYEGEILRASDKKHPKKIAWIQCVGSRSVTPGENSYCSGVCCTYTQKQVILTKDHDEDTECTVFHNDIRSFDKDFEKYFHRAEQLSGIRFIRSYPSIVKEDKETKNVFIRYAIADKGVIEEEFDMVVLSVGLNPPVDNNNLADKFNIELNSYGFSDTASGSPLESTTPGIFISGAFQGPMSISESVYTASGAASKSGELLDRRRDRLTTERIYPPERDVAKEGPRIGVFVCHCGANIGRIVDVPSTVEYARTLPNVVYACEQLFSCATNSAREITDMIKEKGLNRVVVAACSPRTLEPLFRDTLREGGLNQYYFDMANIREHCSWVHAKEPEEATKKAKDITRLSVARARNLEPLREIDLPVNDAALVVGGGIAGMSCALSFAEQGHHAHLVEKKTDLGGMAGNINHTLEGLDVRVMLSDLIKKVYHHPLVHVYTSADIIDTTGYIGNFKTGIRSERGQTDIRHGVTIIATGTDVYEPKEYFYGKNDRVVTQLQLEKMLYSNDDRVLKANTIVMIQCVGCRNDKREYCSRVCCGESVKNALKLKELNPQAEIYILFRDMRTYGFKEDFYRKASERDIKFIRWDQENKPVVDEDQDLLRVIVRDTILDSELVINSDLITLAAAIIPPAGNKKISRMFKVPLDDNNFFREAHVKLRPVEFGTEGVFLCGMAHYPKYIPETINQALGAAGRALTILSHEKVTASGSVCEVNKKKCIGCGACIDVCAYGAINFVKVKGTQKAFVNPVICKGDGLCNVKCPTGAIELKHFTNEEILSQVEAA
jgi:heterodisulfide reductase subunit A